MQQLFQILYRRSDRVLVLLHIVSKRTADPCAGHHRRQERWDTFKALRPFEETARVVIVLRAKLDPTQDLAERMETTKSVISRIESGRHRSRTDTLRRLAEALDDHAVIGFEFDSSDAVRPDLAVIAPRYQRSLHRSQQSSSGCARSVVRIDSVTRKRHWLH